MSMSTQIEMYKAARSRVQQARLRGEDTEVHEGIMHALWDMMSDADKRTVRGIDGHNNERRAA